MAANRLSQTTAARASPEQQKRWRDSWWVRRIVGALAGAALAASCQFLPADAQKVCTAVAQAVGAVVREAATSDVAPDVELSED